MDLVRTDWPMRGRLRGHDGIGATWSIWRSWDDVRLEPSRIHRRGDQVVVHVRCAGAASGAASSRVDARMFAESATGRSVCVDVLTRQGRSPRSRWAVGVGDVAGERGDRAARPSRRTTGRHRTPVARCYRPRASISRPFEACPSRGSIAAATWSASASMGPHVPWDECELENERPNRRRGPASSYSAAPRGSAWRAAGARAAIRYGLHVARRQDRLRIDVFTDRAEALEAVGLSE